MARPRKIKSQLASRLIEARGTLPIEEIVASCDVAASTYAGYERGDTTPDAEFIGKFIKRTGADPWRLLTGTPSPANDDAAHPAAVSGTLLSVASEFAFLPRYGVSASAGGGLVALDENEIERIAFRRDWLHELGIDARQAGLLTATGDSMDPTIPDGALILIDRRQGEAVRSGYIYVLVLDGEVLVKRLARNVDGSIDLISDNPLYPVQRVQQVEFDGLRVAGRVFWVGRKL